jgi:hypothetical protein
LKGSIGTPETNEVVPESCIQAEGSKNNLVMEATPAKTRSRTAQEASDQLKIEEAKPWQVRLDEVIIDIKKIIPEFKGRSMCTICKRDVGNNTANTICSEAEWPKTESDIWLKDYHLQLEGTLAKINNEELLNDMKAMKEKRKNAQADCKAFEGQLDIANRKITVMEAFVQECQGNTRLVEEQEMKLRRKYDENMEELNVLRAQMVSWRKGSKVLIHGRRGSTAENETWKVKQEKDNPAHRQNWTKNLGRVDPVSNTACLKSMPDDPFL